MLQWYYLVLISSVLTGIATVVEKNSLRIEHATAFSAALSPIIAILSAAFIPLANFNITFQQLLLVLGISVLNAYTFLLSARVYKHGELSVSSPIFASLPVLFTVLFAFLFLSEHIAPFQYLSIVGLVVVTYFLMFKGGKSKDGKQAFEGNKYKYMIIVQVLLGAFGNIWLKYILLGMNPYSYLVLSSMFAAMWYAILISVRYRGVREIIETIKTYKLPFVVQALLTVGYRVTFLVGLAVAQVSLAQPLQNTFYVIITVLAGGVLFKEESMARKLLLSLVMIFFAYLLTI